MSDSVNSSHPLLDAGAQFDAFGRPSKLRSSSPTPGSLHGSPTFDALQRRPTLSLDNDVAARVWAAHVFAQESTLQSRFPRLQRMSVLVSRSHSQHDH